MQAVPDLKGGQSDYGRAGVPNSGHRGGGGNLDTSTGYQEGAEKVAEQCDIETLMLDANSITVDDALRFFE